MSNTNLLKYTHDIWSKASNPQTVNTSNNLSLPIENKNTKHEAQLSK